MGGEVRSFDDIVKEVSENGSSWMMLDDIVDKMRRVLGKVESQVRTSQSVYLLAEERARAGGGGVEWERARDAAAGMVDVLQREVEGVLTEMRALEVSVRDVGVGCAVGADDTVRSANGDEGQEGGFGHKEEEEEEEEGEEGEGEQVVDWRLLEHSEMMAYAQVQEVRGRQQETFARVRSRLREERAREGREGQETGKDAAVQEVSANSRSTHANLRVKRQLYNLAGERLQGVWKIQVLEQSMPSADALGRPEPPQLIACGLKSDVSGGDNEAQNMPNIGRGPLPRVAGAHAVLWDAGITI
jgi:hypothetical protein